MLVAGAATMSDDPRLEVLHFHALAPSCGCLLLVAIVLHAAPLLAIAWALSGIVVEL